MASNWGGWGSGWGDDDNDEEDEQQTGTVSGMNKYK